MRKFLLWFAGLGIVFVALRFFGWWGVLVLIWVGFIVTKVWPGAARLPVRRQFFLNLAILLTVAFFGAVYTYNAWFYDASTVLPGRVGNALFTGGFAPYFWSACAGLLLGGLFVAIFLLPGAMSATRTYNITTAGTGRGLRGAYNSMKHSAGMDKGAWLVDGGQIQALSGAKGDIRQSGPGRLFIREGNLVLIEQGGVLTNKFLGCGGPYQVEMQERVCMVVPLYLRSEHLNTENLATRDQIILEQVEFWVFHKVDPGSGPTPTPAGSVPQNPGVAGSAPQGPTGTGSVPQSTGVAGAAPQGPATTGPAPQSPTVTGSARQRVAAIGSKLKQVWRRPPQVSQSGQGPLPPPAAGPDKICGQFAYNETIIREKVWSPAGNDWREGVKNVAQTALRDVIGRHDLADIIPISGGFRDDVKSELKDQINKVTRDKMGVMVTAVDFGEIKVPEAAKQLLLDRWLAMQSQDMMLLQARTKGQSEVVAAQGQSEALMIRADAEAQAMAKKGEGEAMALGSIEKMKTATRADMIREVLAAIYRGKEPVQDEVALRYLDAMEKLSRGLIADDLTALRYVEALEKLAASDGPKTLVIGSQPGMLVPGGNGNS